MPSTVASGFDMFSWQLQKVMIIKTQKNEYTIVRKILLHLSCPLFPLPLMRIGEEREAFFIIDRGIKFCALDKEAFDINVFN
jgi:hypothetical protein